MMFGPLDQWTNNQSYSVEGFSCWGGCSWAGTCLQITSVLTFKEVKMPQTMATIYQIFSQLPPGLVPFFPGCPSYLLHLAPHSLPSLPSPPCLPCWLEFYSFRFFSYACTAWITFWHIQVTIQESREGLAVWLLWGFFELIMKVANCVSCETAVQNSPQRLLICWTTSSICWTTWCGSIRWGLRSTNILFPFSYCYISVVATHICCRIVQNIANERGRRWSEQGEGWE